MDSNSERLLIKQIVQKRDKKAFATIYEQYVKQIYKFVFSRVGNQAWAEVITSETFEALLTALESFKRESSLKNCIYAIAVNKIRSHWYKISKNNETNLEENEYIMDDYSKEVDSIDYSKEILMILGELPENYKNVIQARFLDRKSIKETSGFLKISEANVRVIQNRAINMAKEIFVNKYQNEN